MIQQCLSIVGGGEHKIQEINKLNTASSLFAFLHHRTTNHSHNHIFYPVSMNPAQYSAHLMPHYYPEGVITHLVPEQGAAEAEKLVKGRRRRRKSKGGEGGELMRKRKLSEEQLSMLEKSFGNEHKLESERKERLAAELGLDPRQVAVWFQNRRARWKAKKMEEEYASLRSQLDSTILEKCRLETQVVTMKEELNEAEKEIERLMWEGLRSNSPASSSLSMEEPQFVGGENVYGFQWDDHIYYM